MSLEVSDILRIVAQMLWTDGNINQNVFNAILSGAGSPWSEEDIVDDAVDWLDNMYLNLTAATTDELDGNECTVYLWDTVGLDWDEVASDAFTWNPSGAGDYLPRGVAALAQLWTTNPDVQGKKYLPGTQEANLTAGLYIGGYLTNLLAFAADWYTPFTGAASGATFTPGVWSPTDSAFYAGVDHIAASAIPAYQRRRKRNVGI